MINCGTGEFVLVGPDVKANAGGEEKERQGKGVRGTS